jgi:hypothetical protein
MSPSGDLPQIFSLDQACQLLPHVKHVTADAVRQAESLAAQLRGLPEDDPELQRRRILLLVLPEGHDCALSRL